MFYFTNAQIDEIEKRLVARSKKDTDFDDASEVSESDLVAIIHNGRNVICRLDELPGRLKAVRYNNIPAEITEEDILEAPTAFSISVIKTLLGIEELPDFSESKKYTKGDYVKRVDNNGILRGYVFSKDKDAGYWDDSKAEELNYKSLAKNIRSLLGEFEHGGTVYTLASYFENGKAKRAIADEDGKNIKDSYVLKIDIPEIIQSITELIDGKLDNMPSGSINRPIFINNQNSAEPISGLNLPESIHSEKEITAEWGVAAGGIVDLSLSESGGQGTVTAVKVNGSTYEPTDGIVELPDYPGGPNVVSYNTLDYESSENINRVPTAYGVKIIKEQIDVESLELFSTSTNYHRGDLCKVVDGLGIARGYRFKADKEAGAWDGTKVDRITFKTLAQPLHILESDLLSILTMN